MKKITLIISLFASLLFLPSCLESGLDDLPAFDEAEITNFKFEYRWEQEGKFHVVQLNNQASIDDETNTVINAITLPDANDHFPESIRSQVTLKNIIGYCDISTASNIKPLEGAPKLGVPGDFSKTQKFLVTAADGNTQKTWTIDTTLEVN